MISQLPDNADDARAVLREAQTLPAFRSKAPIAAMTAWLARKSRETPEGRSWEFSSIRGRPNGCCNIKGMTMSGMIWFRRWFSARAFTWREAIAGRVLTPKQREHRDWALGLGIVDVFAVPVHYPGGDFGLCVSIANHPIEGAFERDALQMASLFAHRRCRELGDGAEPAPPRRC
jgi:Autoinducer binding domain